MIGLMLILQQFIMNIKVIGVVGSIGSGKDEVLKYLKSRYSIPFTGTGDIVRLMAEKENLEATRENLEAISLRCFRDLGEGCFVRMAGEEIMGNKWKIAGISGIRSPEDVEVLKGMFGNGFVLIRVNVSDPQLRFERLRHRSEERDPLTYEQFLIQDKNEEETFHISLAGSKADYVIDNNGSLEDLHRQIDTLVSTAGLLNL